eukprot:gene5947-4256_t
MRSAYTLDVGPLGGEDRREVSLLHQGRPCFSTTHAGIVSVLIARFPHLGMTSTAVASHPPGPHSPHLGAPRAFCCARSEEYLCIFHRDELHNKYDRPARSSRSQAIVCTSYQASTSTHQQLPLPDFSPKCFTAGVYGIFIQGGRTEIVDPLGMPPVPPILEIESQCYQAAGDLWWMSSPLVVKPVYLHLEEGVPALGSPYARLNTTVVGQFVALGREVWTVAQSGQELRLAIVRHHFAFDAALWYWLPQRLRLPGPGGQSFTLTVSDHAALEEQVLFLFDSVSATVHVIKTPNLVTGQGDLALLFTLPPGVKSAPITLPCVDPHTPQPVLVSNFPEAHMAALFDMYTLLGDAPTPQSYLCATVINGEVPYKMAREQDPGRVARSLECWPIEGVESESGASLVFAVRLAAASTDAAGEPASARRRYDANAPRRSVALMFPSFGADRHPLQPHILEVCSAALGARAVWQLEYQVIQAAWRRMERMEPLRLLQLLQAALVEAVRYSLYGRRTSATTSSSPLEEVPASSTSATADAAEPLGAFFDPLSFSCAAVERACGPASSPPPTVSRLAADKCTPKSCGLLLVGLHLLFESCKIQEPLWPSLDELAAINLQLSHLLCWPQYVAFYESIARGQSDDQVETVATTTTSNPSESEVCEWALGEDLLRTVGTGSATSAGPVQLLSQLEDIVEHKGATNANISGQCWLVLAGLPAENPISIATRIYQLYQYVFELQASEEVEAVPWWRRVTRSLASLSLPANFVQDQLSLGVAYPLLQAMQIGKTDIGEDCTDEELAVVGRIDRLSPAALRSGMLDAGDDTVRLAEERAVLRQFRHLVTNDDGVVMPPDFPQTWMDTRLERVQLLLSTTAYILLSDAQVKTADKTIIAALGWRACATTVGRGMLTMSTHDFKSCDSVPVPDINRNGMTETGIIVHKSEEADQNDVMLWPRFHNSCAAGLRFFPLPSGRVSDRDGAGVGEVDDCNRTVSREKLIYQWRSVASASRAGLLLAAGLLGHFESLQLTDVYTILISEELDHDIREATAIAVLLGLSCSYRGTNNATVFKCLSVHILSLTPSDDDVEIRLNVQTSAFVAMGFLCQGQYVLSNAFLLEVFLVEMTRLPSDEHCVNREGYTLGAGFGLGLVLLGSGRTPSSVPLIEALLKVMQGARRDPAVSSIHAYESFLERHSNSEVERQTDELIRSGLPSLAQCARVHEGDHYNVMVAGPGAVMALGLIFLKTEDELLARKVAPPDNFKGLNGISPMMCLLRSLVTPLVMWSTIEPSRDWVYRQAPACLNALFMEKKPMGTFRQQRQYFMMNWGHCIAGSLLALSLRYAGTMDPNARDTIVGELKGFMHHCIGSSQVPMTTIQKTTGAFETCLSACCIAASVVMAGTGDQQLFTLFQKLYKRTNVSYGVYMSISMSIGLLFLGGGRLTLSNSTPSIAALLISLYPVWPSDTKDNVRHLQALRHLYALAVVPRVVEAVEVITQRTVSVPIRIHLRHGQACASYDEAAAKRASGLLNSTRRDARHPPEGDSPGQHLNKASSEVWMQTSCLYPPPDMIERIDVCSLRHYNISISHDKGQLSEYGLQLRLLEKSVCDANNVSASVLTHGNRKTVQQHNPVAGRLIDWVKRLFLDDQMSVAEAVAILGNIKIIRAAQRALMGDDVRTAQQLLSHDFERSVQVTLDGRYESIFARKRGTAPTAHPFHMLLVQQMPLGAVIERLSEQLRSSGGSEYMFLGTRTGRGGPQTPLCKKDEDKFRCWFAEMLCYFNLIPATLQTLCNAFQKLQTTLLHSAHQRAVVLLKLHRQLRIPFKVLEEITYCCFGAPSNPIEGCYHPLLSGSESIWIYNLFGSGGELMDSMRHNGYSPSNGAPLYSNLSRVACYAFSWVIGAVKGELVLFLLVRGASVAPEQSLHCFVGGHPVEKRLEKEWAYLFDVYIVPLQNLLQAVAILVSYNVAVAASQPHRKGLPLLHSPR